MYHPGHSNAFTLDKTILSHYSLLQLKKKKRQVPRYFCWSRDNSKRVCENKTFKGTELTWSHILYASQIPSLSDILSFKSGIMSVSALWHRTRRKMSEGPGNLHLLPQSLMAVVNTLGDESNTALGFWRGTAVVGCCCFSFYWKQIFLLT